MSNVIRIYDPIGTALGEYSYKMFAAEFSQFAADEPVVVEINSEGGDMMEGFAIYDDLCRHTGNVTTRVIGGALSIASVIAMAGDNREIADNAFLMIHNGMTMAGGTSSDIRNHADRLDKFNDRMIAIYADALELAPDEVSTLLDAETWFNSEESVTAGLMTSKTEAVKLAARLDVSKFKNTPASLAVVKPISKRGNRRPLQEPIEMATKSTAEATIKPATIKELKAAFPKAKAGFFVAMLEEEKTIEDATAEYMVEQDEQVKAMSDEMTALRAENDELKARLSAMEEDNTVAMEEEEDVKAVARAANIQRPVASVRTGVSRKSAQAMWDEKVNAFVEKGMPRYKAVAKAARIPGLREALVAEANNQ